MNSCLYEGHVRHRRFSPVPHDFTYRVLLFYVDLAEVGTAATPWIGSDERWGLFRLARRDHETRPGMTLDETIRALVAERTGNRPTGPIRLLTQLRAFGYCFNPVSFLYVFDESGARVETVVAEVNNTPWGERHCYVLRAKDATGDGRVHERFTKQFHVSPFMPMDLEYDWTLSPPGDRLAAHFSNVKGQERVFDATLSLARRPLRRMSILSALSRYPLLTQRVTLAIYWQALRLWWKKTPFFPHPKHLLADPSSDRDGRPA